MGANAYLLIGLVILVPTVYFIKEGEQFVWTLLFVKLMAVSVLLINLPNLIILISYYHENKNTKVEIDSERILITKNGISKQYYVSEIESSVYNLGIYYKNWEDNARRIKMMNSDLAYWDLKFNNGDTFYLSNVLIDFLHEEPIFENTEYRFRAFQYIDKSDSKETIELKHIQEKRDVERFVIKLQSKSTSQLKEIIENSDDYQKEAVEAADRLLKNINVG